MLMIPFMVGILLAVTFLIGCEQPSAGTNPFDHDPISIRDVAGSDEFLYEGVVIGPAKVMSNNVEGNTFSVSPSTGPSVNNYDEDVVLVVNYENVPDAKYWRHLPSKDKSDIYVFGIIVKDPTGANVINAMNVRFPSGIEPKNLGNKGEELLPSNNQGPVSFDDPVLLCFDLSKRNMLSELGSPENTFNFGGGIAYSYRETAGFTFFYPAIDDSPESVPSCIWMYCGFIMGVHANSTFYEIVASWGEPEWVGYNENSELDEWVLSYLFPIAGDDTQMVDVAFFSDGPLTPSRMVEFKVMGSQFD